MKTKFFSMQLNKDEVHGYLHMCVWFVLVLRIRKVRIVRSRKSPLNVGSLPTPAGPPTRTA
jgi:hypothetical protein